MSDKHSGYSFNICMCYLPPYKSLKVDAVGFLATLLSQVYVYQKECPFMICGDFNSRIGDNSDYIEGMDDKPERSVLDFESNPYCNKFLDFPLSANCCVLNGSAGVRVQDNYTYVSSKGKSVMDYGIVPYESLHLFSQFKVHIVLDMFMEAYTLGNIDPVHSIPDHSLLTWVIEGV